LVCISLAAALVHAGRSEEAITASQRAQNLLCETRGQREEAKALSSQGAALAKVRRFEDAITLHHQARTSSISTAAM
jgi:Flp pilus assembly protein TadD